MNLQQVADVPFAMVKSKTTVFHLLSQTTAPICVANYARQTTK